MEGLPGCRRAWRAWRCSPQWRWTACSSCSSGSEVVVLGAIGRRTRDEVATWGAVGFLALAALHAIVYEAPPVSLVTGPGRAADRRGGRSAAVAAAAMVLAGAWLEPSRHALRRPRCGALAALTLLYLASIGRGHAVRDQCGARLRAAQRAPTGPDGAERVLGPGRCGDGRGRPAARPGRAPARRAWPCWACGHEGVPVRPGDADVWSTAWCRSSGSACCSWWARSCGSGCARGR